MQISKSKPKKISILCTFKGKQCICLWLTCRIRKQRWHTPHTLCLQSRPGSVLYPHIFLLCGDDRPYLPSRMVYNGCMGDKQSRGWERGLKCLLKPAEKESPPRSCRFNRTGCVEVWIQYLILTSLKTIKSWIFQVACCIWTERYVPLQALVKNTICETQYWFFAVEKDNAFQCSIPFFCASASKD